MLYTIQYGDAGCSFFRKVDAENVDQAEAMFLAWAQSESEWCDSDHRAFIRDEDDDIVGEFTFETN